MAKVYMTVLGTNDYDPCNYIAPDGAVTKNVRFVQEAGISLYCRDWDDSDRIVVFLTETARRTNWEDNGHKNRAGQPKEMQGLRTRLQNLGIKAELCPVPIPDGRNEEEIWKIFETILDNLCEKDEVVFDVTHGFRSIPILAFAVLNYGKALKDIRLIGMVYGALEASSEFTPPPKDAYRPPQDVPLFDLTKYDNLLDWAQAVDRFLVSGDASGVGRLAKEGIRPLLRATRGANTAAKGIDNLAKALEDFTADIATCRCPCVGKDAERVKRALSLCEGQEILKPLAPLMGRVKERIAPFDGDAVRDGIRAARWCLDHNLIQQGYTILEEVLITHLAAQVGLPASDEIGREIASSAYKIKSEKIPPERWLGKAGEKPEITHRCLEYLTQCATLVSTFEAIRKKRNDLNHCGCVAEPQLNAARFRTDLERSLTRAEGTVFAPA